MGGGGERKIGRDKELPEKFTGNIILSFNVGEITSSDDGCIESFGTEAVALAR